VTTSSTIPLLPPRIPGARHARLQSELIQRAKAELALVDYCQRHGWEVERYPVGVYVATARRGSATRLRVKVTLTVLL
jgi:hypothetical protein